MAHSYDIMINMGFYRQRSNTAQNLEKMKIARVKASRIRTVKVDDKVAVPAFVSSDLITRRPVPDRTTVMGRKSRLSETLRNCPKQTQNKFIEYARFDGTAQTNTATRSMRIFLTMLPERLRNYPMTVTVSAGAKIQDFIGLICYKCSISNPDVSLKSVRNYGLYITEEDGEVDPDFPPLDVREPCSKFCFSHLALMERRQQPPPVSTTFQAASGIPAGGHGGQSRDPSVLDHQLPTFRTLSMTSEMESIRHEALISDELAKRKHLQHQQTRDLETMLDHTTMMEAPLYRSYRVHMLAMSALYRTEIQLGISAEKIEIDPVQSKSSTKFWSPKQKAISHNITSIACCELIDTKSNQRAVFRIVYNANMVATGPGANNDAKLSAINAAATTASGVPATSSPNESMSGGGGVGGGGVNLLDGATLTFKHYSFETDHKTAHEIVAKVQNILEVRSSPTRTEYLSMREKRSRRKLRPKTNI